METILGSDTAKKMLGAVTPQKPMLGPGGTQQIFDFTTSNLILMVGGQILILALLLMVVFFGTAPLTFPAQAVRNMIAKGNTSL